MALFKKNKKDEAKDLPATAAKTPAQKDVKETVTVAAANSNAQGAAEKSLLQVKLKDLTPEQIAQLEKPLGTSTHPFPMWDTQRVDINGESVTELVLSAIADDSMPLTVYSERDYKEVVALAYCDMPVPSMLKLFSDGLERRKPTSRNRTQGLIGDPGAGKSFMGALQGRLRSKGKVEVYDCGGKNMNELLFEMVLDFGAGDALPKAIDKRLQAGALEALSLAKLKNLPGAAFDANGNVVSIDWNYFRGNAKPDEVDSAFAILKEVSQIEGLDHAGGNALGMNSQYGALIRAFLEGREIVLDEYNKSKDGSDNALQTMWQFMIGELDSVTVDNPLKNKDATNGPSSFTFKRDDVQAGFFVTLTGNKTEDGNTTRSLNKSVYSRLSPDTLPDPSEADWQHRICQMMVGVPVSTLYAVFQQSADANPKEFGEWLLTLRREKARIEGVPVPEHQEVLLQNWRNVANASEKLAKFYNAWAQMTDADDLLATGNVDLIEEVDSEYSKKEGIDFRKIKQHLEQALPIRAKMQPVDATLTPDFKNFMKQPTLTEPEYENPSISFGTRLVEFLESTVYNKTEAVGKHKLYEKLTTAMDNFGLRDIVLADGAHSGQKSVEEDLNVTVYNSPDMTLQAQAARKVFCNYLRQVDNQIVEADDDKIITVDRLRKAIKAVAEKDTAETKELFVVNRDHESLGNFPLAGAEIRDWATYPEGTTEADFRLADIVTHEDFMAALALPTVSAKNLKAIWDSNIRPLVEGDAQAPGAEDKDEALLISENASATGLATTTLRVAAPDENGKLRDVSVHIVMNTARGKALVVGEKVPTKLLSAFKEAGIIHVDRNAANAKAQIESALSTLTRGQTSATKATLVDAFKYRNDVEQGDNRTLASLLADKNVDITFGKYLVKTDKKLAA